MYHLNRSDSKYVFLVFKIIFEDKWLISFFRRRGRKRKREERMRRRSKRKRRRGEEEQEEEEETIRTCDEKS